MDILTAFIVIGVAALIHASFQLSVSVLTLLSSHTIGRKRSHGALLRLVGGFVGGVATMTLLLVSFLSLIALHSLHGLAEIPGVVWAAVCGLLVGLGVAVWLFYYRHEPGTLLWIPRGVANYLNQRTKATRHSAEAFSLGLSSVIGELLFIVGPLVVSSLILIQLPALWQIIGLGIYTIIASAPLLIVAGLIGGGHTISSIQRWREDNKYFLQFAGGGGLLVLGVYLYVEKITVAAAHVVGG